jgi:hypothetical protein
MANDMQIKEVSFRQSEARVCQPIFRSANNANLLHIMTIALLNQIPAWVRNCNKNTPFNGLPWMKR